MTKEDRAVQAALDLIEHVRRFDPVVPMLTLDEEIVCRGKRFDQRRLELENATFATVKA